MSRQPPPTGCDARSWMRRSLQQRMDDGDEGATTSSTRWPSNTSVEAATTPLLSTVVVHSPSTARREANGGRPSAGLQPRRSFLERKAVKAETFERKSLKFWVPSHRIGAVIAIMTKYVPIYRRGVIHSVYLDNDEGALYKRRLVREDGAQLLRFRWYGDDSPQQVFVELKTHREMQPSSKERFAMNPAAAMDFLGGRTVSAKETAVAPVLAATCGEMIRRRGLKPVLRSEYYRTAFEDKENTDFRASLDQNLALVRDDAVGSRPGGAEAWVRHHDPATGILNFPHAVLELKIAGHALDTTAGLVDEWIDALETQGGAINTYKFSKYLTGFCSLYPQRVSVVPSWMQDEALVASAQRDLAATAAATATATATAAGGVQRRRTPWGRDTTTTPGCFSCLPSASKGGGPDVYDRKAKGADAKAFMANERTLLSWLRTLMLLVYVGGYFLSKGMWGAGVLIMSITLLGFVYSFYQYSQRVTLLATSAPAASFAEKWGIVAFGGTLILTSGIAVYLFTKNPDFLTGGAATTDPVNP